MAEDKDESQEKSQAPSSRKLEKAAEEGRVVQSKEMYVFTILFAGVFLMYSLPLVVNDFLMSLKSFLQFGPELRNGHSALKSIETAIKMVVKITIIFGLPLCVVCILTQYAIGGGIRFSFKPMEPKLSKINPISGLKKIFSIKGLIELFKALIKVFFLGGITIFVFNEYLPEITHLSHPNLFSALKKLLSFFPILLAALLVGLAVIGAIDFAWQKYDFIKQLRMSHQDIKDEYKETDGQPEVKQKIRKLQMQAANKNNRENASIKDMDKATAIITNPTHFAVALKYEVGESDAPKIIAKGRGKIAERIIDEAKKRNIGKLESPDLARALYYTTEIGEEVMSKLYNAVAIALAYIYKINSGESIEKPLINIPEELIFDEFGNQNDK